MTEALILVGIAYAVLALLLAMLSVRTHNHIGVGTGIVLGLSLPVLAILGVFVVAVDGLRRLFTRKEKPCVWCGLPLGTCDHRHVSDHR